MAAGRRPRAAAATVCWCCGETKQHRVGIRNPYGCAQGNQAEKKECGEDNETMRLDDMESVGTTGITDRLVVLDQAVLLCHYLGLDCLRLNTKPHRTLA